MLGRNVAISMLCLMSDHRPLHELREWLDQIRGAPSTEGRIELIVRRPVLEAREVITRGELCTTNGLIGDNWSAKPTSATGTRLAVGAAEIEVTDEPHLGCGKFVRRFGIDAQKFVNSPDGRALNCRGINARVVIPGMVRTGDAICKLT